MSLRMTPMIRVAVHLKVELRMFNTIRYKALYRTYG
jgi:hypothetical protein